MSTAELLSRLAEVEGRLTEMHTGAGEIRSLDADEQTEWDSLLVERDTLVTEREARAARAVVAASIKPVSGAFEVPNIALPIPKPDEMDLRTATSGEIRDAALKHVERKVTGLGRASDEDAQANAERLIRGSEDIARHAVAFGGDVYEMAFRKGILGRQDQWTGEERAALSTTTTTQGGFLVPTHLDPSVILTNAGISHPYRQIARVETLGSGSDQSWNGVSSAGVTASWDGELVEVSDDSPTFAQPTVSVHKQQAFVQASGEILTDASISIADEVLKLLIDASDRLEGIAFSTGSGSGQPWGIFTALDANTNVELSNTTAATLGAVDLYNAFKTVGPRFRGMSSWVMNVVNQNTIRQLGTTDPNFTVNLLAPGIPELLGRPVYEDSSAPGTPSSTTQVENWLVFGDFSNFLIVDKIGTRVQFIPALFNTANNLPDDRVGWHMAKRVGSDSINDSAFVVLQDKTSA